jgi:hypothetical protein
MNGLAGAVEASPARNNGHRRIEMRLPCRLTTVPRSRCARNLCIGVMQPAYTHGTPAAPCAQHPLPTQALSAILPRYPGTFVAG